MKKRKTMRYLIFKRIMALILVGGFLVGLFGCAATLVDQKSLMEQITTMSHKDRVALAMAVHSDLEESYMALYAELKKMHPDGLSATIQQDLQQRKKYLTDMEKTIETYDKMISTGQAIDQQIVQQIITFLQVHYVASQMK